MHMHFMHLFFLSLVVPFIYLNLSHAVITRYISFYLFKVVVFQWAPWKIGTLY